MRIFASSDLVSSQSLACLLKQQISLPSWTYYINLNASASNMRNYEKSLPIVSIQNVLFDVASIIYLCPTLKLISLPLLLYLVRFFFTKFIQIRIAVCLSELNSDSSLSLFVLDLDPASAEVTGKLPPAAETDQSSKAK